MNYDGDNAGRLVGRAILADNVDELHEVSDRITHGHDIVKAWVKEHGGKIISGGGDEGSFIIPQDAVNDIERLRKDYQFATKLTMTVGVGKTLSEAGKSLMVGKFRGKNQVVMYDESVDQELAQSQEHIDQGTASDEEKKLGEAYLKPQDKAEGDNCPHCKEYNQENGIEGQDSHKCQYCDEYDSKESSDHSHDDCPHCQEYDANQASPEGQADSSDCPHCQEYDAQANVAEEGHEQAPMDDTGIIPEMSDAQAAPDAQGTPEENMDSKDSMLQIASQIEQEGQAQGEEALPLGDVMEDDTSRPEDYNDNTPGDMGLAEDEIPEERPDLTDVLQGGLDSHADNIKREKVVVMVSQALQGFKANKQILERAKDQAPQLYESTIAMLKAMIEMAKMLGLGNPSMSVEEQPQDSPAEQPEPNPAAAQEDAAQAPKADRQ